MFSPFADLVTPCVLSLLSSRSEVSLVLFLFSFHCCLVQYLMWGYSDCKYTTGLVSSMVVLCEDCSSLYCLFVTLLVNITISILFDWMSFWWVNLSHRLLVIRLGYEETWYFPQFLVLFFFICELALKVLAPVLKIATICA